MGKLLVWTVASALCFPIFGEAKNNIQQNPFLVVGSVEDNIEQNPFQDLIDKVQQEKKESKTAIAISLFSFVALFIYIKLRHPKKNGWIRLCTVLSVIAMIIPVCFLIDDGFRRDVGHAFYLFTIAAWLPWLILFATNWVRQGFKSSSKAG